MTTPLELLQFAESLVGVSEVSDRTAASRAYYAAYHACRDKYTTLEKREGAGMHRSFIDGLIDSNISQDRGIGYMLDSLHRMRIKADYKLSSEFSTANAIEVTNGAGRVIEKVNSAPVL
ncbi:MAG: hypothetical protein BWK73_44990 [Thiothrix lacustris]|uniref:HEPN domain-containing protein n=1 Tax=Thiothrix lacustris TaxID=525917 RepID=A0A1Y1QAZ9_9GAMM|nr:MAG: hypothetical protein BWK73_44990 [Thiothrix lacustris]